jgi:hypothetical protein
MGVESASEKQSRWFSIEELLDTPGQVGRIASHEGLPSKNLIKQGYWLFKERSEK